MYIKKKKNTTKKPTTNYQANTNILENFAYGRPRGWKIKWMLIKLLGKSLLMKTILREDKLTIWCWDPNIVLQGTRHMQERGNPSCNKNDGNWATQICFRRIISNVCRNTHIKWQKKWINLIIQSWVLHPGKGSYWNLWLNY